eukprot:scaffold8.g1570.t1
MVLLSQLASPAAPALVYGRRTPFSRLAVLRRPPQRRLAVRASSAEPPKAPQPEAELSAAHDDGEHPEAADVATAVEDATAEAVPRAPAAERAHAVAPAPGSIVDAGRDALAGPLRIPLVVGAGFLGVTFLVAVVRTVRSAITPKAKRTRTIAKNKSVIDAINKYLPANRAGLSSGALSLLKLQTGFSSAEVWRKYASYVLRERQFTEEAVEDLIHLKAVLGLSDDEVADALRERAQRTYERYGTVMLDTTGMSAAGIERKMASRALFSKLLYLSECDRLLSHEAAAAGVDLEKVFGVTAADVEQLRMGRLSEE